MANKIDEIGAMYLVYHNLFMLSLAVEVIIIVAGYVAKYFIHRDMVALFMYDDVFTIFFTIILLLGPVAYLRNARRALETGKFMHLHYPNRDTNYFQ